MKSVRNIVLGAFLVLCSLAILGCGQKADENKPVSEVKAEAEQMNADSLRAMAMEYKKAIVAKQAEVEKAAAKPKDIPATELLGEQAKQLKADIDNLGKSVNALKQRFQIYYDKLKEKGGDLSDLQV